MKVAPVSADLLIKLAMTAAAVGLAYVVYRKLSGKIDDFGSGISDTASNIAQSARDAVNNTLAAAGAVADGVVTGVNPNNPENWINRLATAGVNYVAGDDKPIGVRIYDYFNPDTISVAMSARADYAKTDPRRLDQNEIMNSYYDAMGNQLGAGLMFAALLPGLMAILGKLIPDPEARAAAQLKLIELQASGQLAELNAAVAVIVAEASGNWLQRSWRPIMMLTFTGLIVARWMGFAAPNLQPDEYLKLWEIVQLGIGGYVIGRSVEKTVPAIAAAIKDKAP